jgi:hypothetical protein
MMTTETSIVQPDFLVGVSSVLEPYYGGFYCEARHAASELRKKHGGEGWEASIIRALDCWMTEWNGMKAVGPLKASLSGAVDLQDASPRDVFQTFYTSLFIALLCCRETRNPTALAAAESAATRATRMESELAKALGKLPEEGKLFRDRDNTAFFPRPWCASWFRAVSRASLGLRGDALSDYKRAYSDLAELVRQERRAAADKSDMIPGSIEKAGADPGRVLDIADDPSPFILAASRQPIMARFLHDVGMFLFEEGDWGYDPVRDKERPPGAQTFLDLAARLAGPQEAQVPRNPYVRAGKALFYSFTRREAEAFEEIHQAFQDLEEARVAWQEENPGEEYYATGRIHFQAGLLAYKYLRGQIRITEGEGVGQPHPERIKELEGKIAKLSKSPATQALDLLACFRREQLEDALWATQRLFAVACRYYLRIKNPFKSLSALILMADPLRYDKSAPRQAARQLIWELAYGMGGDFTGNLIGYENLITRHFMAPSSGE